MNRRKRRRRATPKVVERPLGRERARGQAIALYNLIEIDPRQTERARLNTLIHEALHLGDWGLSETKVIKLSGKVASVLWAQGYRRPNRA